MLAILSQNITGPKTIKDEMGEACVMMMHAVDIMQHAICPSPPYYRYRRNKYPLPSMLSNITK